MESSLTMSKVEVIKQAIKEVMEEIRGGANSSSDDGGDVEDDNHHRLLSKLMSQLEKLEAEQAFVDDEKTKTKINKSRSEEEKEDEKEKIVKELKKMKRQNLITHCLLSAMIVLTVVWQISEVSIILRLKDGVNHPFRFIGSIFKRILTPPKANGIEDETDSSITNNLIESSRVGDLKIPELPHVELPKTQTWFLKDKD
ncbi:unnamed protein product [Lactuca saligna]|uniref:Uncharacterized protein n=1 Tax=Lactuca saligna TaxID=75948 RepID=A0AA36E109_LACSI|nr:unnamed protein product [Lactuca saligna]